MGATNRPSPSGPPDLAHLICPPLLPLVVLNGPACASRPTVQIEGSLAWGTMHALAGACPHSTERTATPPRSLHSRTPSLHSRHPLSTRRSHVEVKGGGALPKGDAHKGVPLRGHVLQAGAEHVRLD